MTISYLEALAAIAVSLSLLMAGAFLVQQRTGNSGWVETIWTFSLGLVGVGSALWPVAGAAPNARQWLVAALVVVWSLRLGAHIAERSAEITDDPRYAAFAKEWGVDSRRKMFIFLQNQGFGSIPLMFAIFVAARLPGDVLRLQDYLGALILLAGIAGEALADAQLKRFRNQPPNQGRVCLSRHRALARPPASVSLGLGDAAGAGLHVLDPGSRHRHPAAGATDAALARRSLSGLSVGYESVLSAAAASMIPTRRAALAQSGGRVSEMIMLKIKGVVT